MIPAVKRIMLSVETPSNELRVKNSIVFLKRRMASGPRVISLYTFSLEKLNAQFKAASTISVNRTPSTSLLPFES